MVMRYGEVDGWTRYPKPVRVVMEEGDMEEEKRR